MNHRPTRGMRLAAGLIALVLVTILAPDLVAAETASAVPPVTLKVAAELRDHARKSSKAFEIVQSLTTEVGPRLAGTTGDTAAVAWALTTLKDLGFTNVHAEPVTVPRWVRGSARVEITGPYPQPLTATSLGYSIGTPDDGIEAPVVQVHDLADLAQLDASDIQGKIVYFSERMQRSRDGSGYGKTVAIRMDGPSAAARLGAVAVVIRSVGTDHDRMPHTGMTQYQAGVTRIPALALSNPDADLLETQLATGSPVTLRIRSSARTLPPVQSANVVGELAGHGQPDEVVLLGAHLDSWDLGTGAIDDGAGVAIVTEAVRQIAELGLRKRPRRTLRVVLYADEEEGLIGAKAYADAHKDDAEHIVMAMESDLGADSVYEMDTGVAPAALPVMAAIQKVLAPLGIAAGNNGATGDSDTSTLFTLGVPCIELRQDATRYFDYHHTANDTLDKVDPKQLDQNVAAFATVAYIAASVRTTFGPPPAPAGDQPAETTPAQASPAATPPAKQPTSEARAPAQEKKQDSKAKKDTGGRPHQ